MVEESLDASCATEHSIDPRFVFQSFLHSLEGLLDLVVSYFMVLIGQPMLTKNIIRSLSVGSFVFRLYIVYTVLIEALNFKLISFLIDIW